MVARVRSATCQGPPCASTAAVAIGQDVQVQPSAAGLPHSWQWTCDSPRCNTATYSPLLACSVAPCQLHLIGSYDASGSGCFNWSAVDDSCNGRPAENFETHFQSWEARSTLAWSFCLHCGGHHQHVHPDLGRRTYPHLRLVRSGHVDAGDGATKLSWLSETEQLAPVTCNPIRRSLQ